MEMLHEAYVDTHCFCSFSVSLKLVKNRGKNSTLGIGDTAGTEDTSLASGGRRPSAGMVRSLKSKRSTGRWCGASAGA